MTSSTFPAKPQRFRLGNCRIQRHAPMMPVPQRVHPRACLVVSLGFGKQRSEAEIDVSYRVRGFTILCRLEKPFERRRYRAAIAQHTQAVAVNEFERGVLRTKLFPQLPDAKPA